MNALLKQASQPQDKSIRHIHLTQGQVAIVDAADYKWLMQWKWCANWSVNAQKFYAKRAIKTKDVKRTQIGMHQAIMGTDPGEEVDHRDNDGLNNRRSNLRRCTHRQNLANQKPRKGKYKGVHFYKRHQLWSAYICPNYTKIHLGYFATEKEAALAYDAAAIRHFGEFARLNFPSHDVKVRK